MADNLGLLEALMLLVVLAAVVILVRRAVRSTVRWELRRTDTAARDERPGAG